MTRIFSIQETDILRFKNFVKFIAIDVYQRMIYLQNTKSSIRIDIGLRLAPWDPKNHDRTVIVYIKNLTTS